MNDQFEIDVPDSYGENEKKNESTLTEIAINDIPDSTNKVRKKIIRGVLKGDGSSQDQ